LKRKLFSVEDIEKYDYGREYCNYQKVGKEMNKGEGKG
jgi:hypothetical protein